MPTRCQRAVLIAAVALEVVAIEARVDVVAAVFVVYIAGECGWYHLRVAHTVLQVYGER
jgi:hypothetical protein